MLTRPTRVRANVVPAGSVLHYTCLPGHDLQVLYYAVLRVRVKLCGAGGGDKISHVYVLISLLVKGYFLLILN